MSENIDGLCFVRGSLKYGCRTHTDSKFPQFPTGKSEGDLYRIFLNMLRMIITEMKKYILLNIIIGPECY
jgi:hypothetical protein